MVKFYQDSTKILARKVLLVSSEVSWWKVFMILFFYNIFKGFQAGTSVINFFLKENSIFKTVNFKKLSGLSRIYWDHVPI